MKIVFAEWGGFGSEDVKAAFVAEGHELIRFLFPAQYGRHNRDAETENRLSALFRQEVPDVMFSLNYFPVISRVCQQEKIRYISWTYDCPCFLLYSATIINSCNVAYVFD